MDAEGRRQPFVLLPVTNETELLRLIDDFMWALSNFRTDEEYMEAEKGVWAAVESLPELPNIPYYSILGDAFDGAIRLIGTGSCGDDRDALDRIRAAEFALKLRRAIVRQNLPRLMWGIDLGPLLQELDHRVQRGEAIEGLVRAIEILIRHVHVDPEPRFRDHLAMIVGSLGPIHPASLGALLAMFQSTGNWKRNVVCDKTLHQKLDRWEDEAAQAMRAQPHLAWPSIQCARSLEEASRTIHWFDTTTTEGVFHPRTGEELTARVQRLIGEIKAAPGGDWPWGARLTVALLTLEQLAYAIREKARVLDDMRNERRVTAFLMSTHPRLGAGAPVHSVGNDVLERIARHLRYDDR